MSDLLVYVTCLKASRDSEESFEEIDRLILRGRLNIEKPSFAPSAQSELWMPKRLIGHLSQKSGVQVRVV